jgi:hypothetical protein
MKTQIAQGSFISLMLTLAQQIRYATSVPHHSRAEALACLPLTHLLARSLGRRKEEQLRPNQLIFRYSSSNQSASSCFSGVLR